jgi:hypothetical protein
MIDLLIDYCLTTSISSISWQAQVYKVPMQSVPIITFVLGSNPAQAKCR